MVSKPYYRVDLFNRQMTNILLTSLLVTTIENKTVAHIGTSTGRLLQVHHTGGSCSHAGCSVIFFTVASAAASNIMLFLCLQLVLTRSSPIIFANYSLVENQRVSSIAAVYSSEYLLFVVGDKVQRQSQACKREYNRMHALWFSGGYYHVMAGASQGQRHASQVTTQL